MISPTKQTAAQKKYALACDACRQWAGSATPEILSAATPDRVSASYGIKPADAANIILKASLKRSL